MTSHHAAVQLASVRLVLYGDIVPSGSDIVEVMVTANADIVRAAQERATLSVEYRCPICAEHHTADAEMTTEHDAVWLAIPMACEGPFSERDLIELHEDDGVLAAVQRLGPPPSAAERYYLDLRAGTGHWPA